jgi:hypothetical protein
MQAEKKVDTRNDKIYMKVVRSCYVQLPQVLITNA